MWTLPYKKLILLHLLTTQAVLIQLIASHTSMPSLPSYLHLDAIALLFIPFSQGLLQFGWFKVITLLLMFSCLHPSFFPSNVYCSFLLFLLKKFRQWTSERPGTGAGTHEEESTKALVLLDLKKRHRLTRQAPWPLFSNTLLLLPHLLDIPEGKLEKHY